MTGFFNVFLMSALILTASSAIAEGPDLDVSSASPIDFIRSLSATEEIFPLCPQRELGCYFVDASGEQLTRPFFTSASPFSKIVGGNSLAEVHIIGGGRGLLDRQGNWLIPPVMTGRSNFYFGDEVIITRYPKKGPGFLNHSIEWVLAPGSIDNVHYQFGDLQTDTQLIPSDTNGRTGYLDTSGRWVIPPQFDYASVFSLDGLAPAILQKGAGAGFIDRSGKWAIQPRFKSANGFMNGLAAVTATNGLGGYIDTSGNWVIPPNFSGMGGNFTAQGYASVSLDGKDGIIDRSRNWVLTPQYARAFFENPLSIFIKTRDGDKWDYLNTFGQWVIQPLYDDVNEVGGLIRVRFGNSQYEGYVSRSGEPLTFSLNDFMIAEVECPH